MVVLSIAAIFLGFGVPALSSMIAGQQVRSASADLHATLAIARSEALTRNSSVTVAPVAGGWAQGWTITAGDGTVLRRQDRYARLSLTGPAAVMFNGDGRPDAAATPFSISAADAPADAARCVRLRLSGRSAIDKGAC